jgi:hypothetical protein
MMSDSVIKAAETTNPEHRASHASMQNEELQSEEQRSKDAFFVQIAEIADAMIARHGKEFTMGALILAARFIAENRPLVTQRSGRDDR